MTTARRPPQSSALPQVGAALAGLVAAAWAAWWWLPSTPLIWCCLLVAGWLARPPLLTGRKDATGAPTPAVSGELRRLRHYRFWRLLRTSMWPGPWGSPGAARLAAVWASVAAVAAALLPASEPLWRILNAAAGYITVTGLCAARRGSIVVDDECPPVDAKDLVAVVRRHPSLLLAAAAGAVAAGVAIGRVVPTLPTAFPVSATAIIATASACGGLAVLTGPWLYAGTRRWRAVVARREEWASRWAAIVRSTTPPPRLIDTALVGPVRVDTFDAPAGLGAAAFYRETAKVATTLSAHFRVGVVDVPAEGPDGPIRGTRHPRHFQVVSWDPDTSGVDLADPGLSAAVAELVLRAEISVAFDARGWHRPSLVGATRVTADGTATVWLTRWRWHDPVTLDHFAGIEDVLAEAWRVPLVAIDTDRDAIFCGAELDHDIEFLDSEGRDDFGDLAAHIVSLRTVAQWQARWGNVLKAGVFRPDVHLATIADFELADGTVIHRVPHVLRQGSRPEEFFGLERKLSTTLSAAPWVSVTGWNGATPSGVRHAGAITVWWSSDHVPLTAQEIAPSPAAPYVLIGHVNRAFDAVRLARPELISATPLTTADSPAHLWELRLRLDGGVTVGDVRKASTSIQSSLQATYLRIVPGRDRAEIAVIVGETHRSRRVLLGNEHEHLRLEDVDWDHFFTEAGIVAPNGEKFTLLAKTAVETADHLHLYRFTMPPTVTLEWLRSRTEHVKTAAGVAYIAIRPIPSTSSEFEMVVGDRHPLPDRAPLDFNQQPAAGFHPYGTGIMGTAAGWDTTVDPHILISGKTGSGKSVAIQTIVYSLLAQGWEVAIADPTKGCADFKFAEPYCIGWVTDLDESAAMMRHVYDIVTERKQRNAAHGAGSWRDLPAELQPLPLAVVIDEFFSLVAPLRVPARSDNPELESLRNEILETNYAKETILDTAARIAREARAAGVHLLLAAQRPDAKLLQGEMKFNLSARVLMGSASTVDRMVALRSPNDVPNVTEGSPIGRGITESSASSPEMFQGWYATQAELADGLAAVRTPSDERNRLTTVGSPPVTPTTRPTPASGRATDPQADCIAWRPATMPPPPASTPDPADPVLDDADEPDTNTDLWGPPTGAATHLDNAPPSTVVLDLPLTRLRSQR